MPATETMVNGSSARQSSREEDERPNDGARLSGQDLRTTSSTVTRPPVLASEALREELAPIEPGKTALRLWMVALAVLIAASGLAAQLGWLQGAPGHATIAYVIAAIVLVSVAIPYRFRGGLVAAAAYGLLVAGLWGSGPLSAIAARPWSSVWAEVARMLGASALAGALLFRARYRAYRGARVALIVALVLTVPALVNAGLEVAAGAILARVAGAVIILSVVASLTGFMGSGTTGASTAWAVTVVVAFALDILARAVWMDGPMVARIGQIHGGVLFAAAASLAAIGIFKMLASALAGDARQVDVLSSNQLPESTVSDNSEGSD